MVVAVFGLWTVSDHPAPAPPKPDGPTEEIRDLSAFTGIISRFDGNIVLKQGSPASVKVVGDEKAVKKLKTEIKNDNLEIFFSGKNRRNDESDLTVYITMPDIESLSLIGGGDLRADSSFIISTLTVSLAGSGDIILQSLDGNRLDVNVAGSGDFSVLGGEVKEANLNVAGSGNMSLQTLTTQDATVSVAGSGDVTISAIKTLNATVAGSGNVQYHGKPTVIKKVFGSGEITALDE